MCTCQKGDFLTLKLMLTFCTLQTKSAEEISSYVLFFFVVVFFFFFFFFFFYSS